MQRRDFVQTALKFLASGFLVPASWRWAGAAGAPRDTSFLREVGRLTVLDDKILVLINLAGGNDGLNCVIPTGDPLYYAYRPNIAIPAGQTVPIANGTGLHPNLAPLQPLWDAGRMAVIQGVTYPNPNLSHFRSTDIWFSGSSAEDTVATGWMARFIETVFPEFPDILPLAPYGLQQAFGHTIPLQGDRGKIGVVVDNPDTFFELVNQNYTGPWSDELPDTRGGEELEWMREMDLSTFAYAEAIRDAADAGTNTVAYPQTTLGIQLEIVARLISGQLDTPIFLTAEFGFDTHVNQLGVHAQLMASLGQSMRAFMDDMDNQGLSDRVLVVTTSEFGRRPNENGGFGTDHGAGAPVLVAGTGVQGGMYGTNPQLDNLDQNGNLLLQHDFRSVYTTLLRRYWGADQTVAADVLDGDFDVIEFLQNPVNVPTTPGAPRVNRLFGAVPNPASLARSDRVLIRFDLTDAADVEIGVFDVRGRRVAEFARRRYPAGRHRLAWEVGRLSPGIYLTQIRAGSWSERGKIQILP